MFLPLLILLCASDGGSLLRSRSCTSPVIDDYWGWCPTLKERLPDGLPSFAPNDENKGHADNQTPLPANGPLIEDTVVEARDVDGWS